MARLDEETVWAGVPFAVNRDALGKERGLAVGFDPPKLSRGTEQPLPRMLGEVFEGHRSHTAHRA